MPSLPCSGPHRHFNPRSREGSDRAEHEEFRRRLEISIHASAKGATTSVRHAVLVLPISIHAPAKGATTRYKSAPKSRNYFNPRSREGSDRPRLAIFCRIPHFNPRSREGSDDFSAACCARVTYFNPRSHEGSDSGARFLQNSCTNFNPRSREGSDF